MQPPANIVITAEPTTGPPVLSPAASPAAVEESPGLSWALALNTLLDADKKHFQKVAVSFREKKSRGTRLSVQNEVLYAVFFIYARCSPR